MFKKLIIPVSATAVTASGLGIYLRSKSVNEELKKLEEQKKSQEKKIKEQEEAKKVEQNRIAKEEKARLALEETERQSKERESRELKKQEIRNAEEKILNDLFNECKNGVVMKNQGFWGNKYRALKKDKASFSCNQKTVTFWSDKKFANDNSKISDTTKRWWTDKDEISIFISIEAKK